MALPAEYIPLALAYQRQVDRMRQQLAAVVGGFWDSLGSYREGDISRFVGPIAPLIAGAQRNMVSLTTSYLAQQRALVLGDAAPVVVDPTQVTGAAARGGTSAATVYERPFHLVWRQLDTLPREAGSIEQAIAAGRTRAVDLARDDMQLAKVQTAHRVLSRDRHVSGYRRVLEGSHSCGLCIVASTQRYHRGDLMPIHGGCDCGVAPIYGDVDPGHVIDPDTLENVHQRVADRFKVNARDARAVPDKGLPAYQDVLVVHHHGELGPVLGVRGEKFLGPDDIAA